MPLPRKPPLRPPPKPPRETARRRAAELGHEGYRGTRRQPPYDEMIHGNRTFGDRSYHGGTYSEGSPPPPPEVDGRRPRYGADYPPTPMFYGPAYPPPWFNAARPEPYPDRWGWGRGPAAPW